MALRGILPDVATIQLANAVIFAGHGLMWSGIRVFGGSPLRPILAAAGPVAWLAACQVPAFYGDITLRVMLASLIVSLYVFAGALQLWRSRNEELRSSRLAITLLVIHGLFYLVRVPLALVLPLPQNAQSLQSVWIAVLTMETILHVIAIGFVFFGLAKERLELEQRIAATTDPLTGVLNRRGFMSRAGAELEGASQAGRPAALLLFDIDHFKRINDCWGHDADLLPRSLALPHSSAASVARNSPASSGTWTRTEPDAPPTKCEWRCRLNRSIWAGHPFAQR